MASAASSLKHASLNLLPRHIQNFSDAQYYEPHWGYDDRPMPCAKDAATCAYLTAVYHGHDTGMLYIGVIWATILGILLIWAAARHVVNHSGRPTILGPAAAHSPEIQQLTKEQRGDTETSMTAFAAQRNTHAAESIMAIETVMSEARRRLLPEVFPAIFGRTTRLQALVLAMLVGYLAIFSFTGLIYGKWISPVSGGLHSTRTTLGPWADRIGILAYGMTPLSVLLSSRESILSLVTGLPYTKFNFLHRWLGYVIVAQSILHTISWTVIEARLYQPQPQEGREWIAQLYMRWGLVAIATLMLLFVFSLPCVIRRTGYEFFRKTHYVLAMVYIGACWGHWSKLKVFLLPSLLIWFLDRALRLLRSYLLHYNFISPENSCVAFRPARASVQVFADPDFGDVVRLDFNHQQQPWQVGQHFYLCFTELSIWQSHPFTPLSYPTTDVLGRVRHSYVLRAKGGETQKLAKLALAKVQGQEGLATSSVVLAGPYGQANSSSLEGNVSTNVLCLAGGTGITYVLPIIKHAALLRSGIPSSDAARIELVWIVKRASDTSWVQRELSDLQSNELVTVRIVTTREEVAKKAVLTSEGKSRSINDATPSEKDDITVAAESKRSKSACCCDGREPDSMRDAEDDKSPCELHTECGRANGAGRPTIASLINSFLLETTVGASSIYASGPGSMLSDVRRAVADCNGAAAIWNGNDRADVRLTCDDRMEWV